MTTRSSQYKNEGKDLTSQRKNRVENALTLRKDKRDEIMAKRRNIPQEIEPDASGDTPLNSLILPEVVLNAQSQDRVIRLRAVINTRRLLSSDNNPPIDALIDSGILPILVQCLQEDDPTIQFEAAWALTNIASGNTSHTHAVVKAGAVPHLIRLLASGDLKICEQSLWALGNIVGDGSQFRDYCIKLGLLELLVAFVRPDIPVSFLQNVTWVIVNVCRNKEPPPTIKVFEAILPSLVQLIQHTVLSILIDTIWAFGYITDIAYEHVQLVINSGALQYLIPMLGHNDVKILAPALRCIGNIVTGTDEQTQTILDFGALSFIKPLLDHPKEKIKKEAVWFISNVTAGSSDQIQSVIDAGLLPKVIELMQHGEFLIKNEAAWAISNVAVIGTPDQLWYLVEKGAIESLCSLLFIEDAQITVLVLDALHRVLEALPDNYDQIAQLIEASGGLDQIEMLQNNGNKEIYELAFRLIEDFFSETEEGKLSEHEGFKFEKSQDLSNQFQF